MFDSRKLARLFIATTLALGACGPTEVATTIEPLTPGVPHYGHTHEELSAAWWSWLYGLPQEGHPVLDATGEHCANGQPDGVFFLAGTYGETARRTCTVPAGRPIFFPVVNIATFNLDVPGVPVSSEDEMIAYARDSMDAMDAMELEIDGVTYDMEALAELRVATRFGYDVPDVHPNMFDRYGITFSGHVEPAFSDGFWVFLPPLPPGDHHIAFTASDEGDPMTTDDDWALDVEYELSVE